jgi:drug/metabolite transporter (DMT)-like permease
MALFALPAALLAGIIFSVMSIGYKLAEVWQCRIPAFALAFSGSAAVLTGGMAACGHPAWGDWRLWALGVGAGVLFMPGMLLVVQSFRAGSVAVAWTVLNLSVLIPILAAPALFHEPLVPVDGVSLLAFLLMLVAFALGMDPADPRRATARPAVFAGIVGVLFVINGSFMLMQKIETVCFTPDSAAGFAFIFYATAAVLCAITVLVQSRGLRLTAPEARAGVLGGTCSGTGVLLALFAQSHLPVIVVLPIIQGLALAGGVLVAVVIYKERLNGYKVAGLAIGAVVLLLATFRGPLTARFAPVPTPAMVQER